MHQPEVVVLLLSLIISFCHSAPLDETPIVLNVEAAGGIFKGSNCETIIRGPDGSKIVSDLENQIVTIEAGKLQSPNIVAPVKNDADLATVEAPSKIATVLPVHKEEVAIPSSVSIPEEMIASVSTQQSTDSAAVKNDVIIQSIDAGIEAKPEESSFKSQDHVFETIMVDAPEVEPEIDFDLKGSSGRIITKGSISVISGPSSTTISAVEVNVPKEFASVISGGTVEPQEVVSAGQIPVKIVNDGPIIAAETASLPLPEPEPEKLTVGVISESVVKSDNSVAASSSDAASVVKQSIPVIPQQSSTNENNSLSSADGNNNSHLEPVALTSTSLLATAESTSENKNNNNVQKIPKIENIVIPNGRVDLGEFENEKENYYYYNLPHVLSMALSSFYRKSSSSQNPPDKVEIDDKIGDLSENEVLFDNSRTLIPPDLSKTKHIGPALSAKGVDASQIFLERIPLRDVSRLAKSGPEIFGVERAYRIM